MIDAEALGKSFYEVGVALGNAMNYAIETINSVDWSTLAKNWSELVDTCDSYQNHRKTKSYRKHERPILTAEEYATKSNNWLHMHGYPTRRRGGKRKCQ